MPSVIRGLAIPFLPHRLRIRALAHAITAFVVAACGGGGDGGTTNPPVTPPGFTVSLSATTLTIEQGATGTINATVTRTGSFTGAVDVSVEGLPAGVTATVTPASIGSGATSGSLAVAVGASVAPGSYNFTVRARATGLSDQTFAASMTVTARPAIAIALTPATAPVPQAGNSSFTASVSRTNFTGAVAVAVTGAPTGVTTTVTQATDVFTVAVAVSLNTPEGSYPLTVTASGTGVANATATYTLVVVPRPASIQLEVNGSATRTVSAGGLAVSTTIIVRRTEFLGEVTLAVDGTLPTGVSANISPSPTTGNSIVVSLSATAQATPGTYPITLKGTGPGIPAASVQLTLVVNPFASIASISLSRTTVSVAQGGTGSTTATIVRSSFTGAVTFAVTGEPNGVTVALGNNPTSTSSMPITLTVAPNVAPGSYPLTVSASAAGVATVSTTLTLSVTLGGQVGNTTFQFCGSASELPIWFAAQPGALWQRILPSSPNTYSFDIGNSGGAAWVTQDAANQTTLHLFYGTQAELAAQGAGYCVSPSGKQVTGSVAGLGATDRAGVYLGPRSALTPTLFAPNFTLSGLPDGLLDLVALRTSFTSLQPDRIIIQRGLDPANNASLGTLNFAGASAVAPATRSVTIQNMAGGEQSYAASFFRSANGTMVPIGTSIPGVGTTHTVGTVPAASFVTGDLHTFVAFAGTFSGNTLSAGRTTSIITSSAADPTIALGATFNDPDVATGALGNNIVRVRTRITIQPDYDKLWLMQYSQSSGGINRNVIINVSGAYQALIGGPQLSLNMPDLAPASGWQPTWGLQNNVLISWTVYAYGWSGGSGLAQPTLDGTTVRGAFKSGSYTPP
ncbi:MAG: putative Ig domain-containing protein [Gemmatimonadetes bacterium]|nr:putative Ig domain-containing protein [Gemmatimonadota bacterium]